MPVIGGYLTDFPRMAVYLGEDQPVYGLIPRGLDGREPYHTTVEDIAAYYVDAIRKVQPEGSYRLVGHSFGGTVAFEAAQQLLARGGSVSFLGLFDTIEWQYMLELKKSFETEPVRPGFRERLAIYRTEFKQAVLERDPFGLIWQRAKNRTSRTVSSFFRASGRPLPEPAATMDEVHYNAGLNYRPKVYPGRLTLFRSITRRPVDGDDPFLGWDSLVAGGIDVHHVAADHFNIIKEPAVKILSDKLQQCLDRDYVLANADLQLAEV